MPITFSHGYALLIGVGQSAYAPWSLPASVKDAQAICTALTDPACCAYLDDADHVRLLHDAGATQAAVLESRAWLTTQTSASIRTGPCAGTCPVSDNEITSLTLDQPIYAVIEMIGMLCSNLTT